MELEVVLADIEKKYFEAKGKELRNDFETGKISLRLLRYERQPQYHQIQMVDGTGFIRLIVSIKLGNIEDMSHDLYYLSHRYYLTRLPENIKTRVKNVIRMVDGMIRQPEGIELRELDLHPAGTVSDHDLADFKEGPRWWTFSQIDIDSGLVILTSYDWILKYEVRTSGRLNTTFYADDGADYLGTGKGFFKALDAEVLRVFKTLKSL